MHWWAVLTQQSSETRSLSELSAGEKDFTQPVDVIRTRGSSFPLQQDTHKLDARRPAATATPARHSILLTSQDDVSKTFRTSHLWVTQISASRVSQTMRLNVITTAEKGTLQNTAVCYCWLAGVRLPSKEPQQRPHRWTLTRAAETKRT